MTANRYKEKNLFVLQYGTMIDVLYNDLKVRDDTDFFYVANPSDYHSYIEKIRKIHTSIRLSQKIEIPFKKMWYRDKLLAAARNASKVFFSLDAAIHVGLESLAEIKRELKGTKLILILLDSINAHSWVIKYGKHYAFDFPWDAVLSFDNNDCKTYGFIWIGTGYYSKIDNLEPTSEKSDLFYIGQIKNEPTRVEHLREIGNKCREHNIRFDCRITGNIDNMDNIDATIMEKQLPYIESLRMMLSTNCILELVQPGQKNQTVRYMEAVCYNKKLLTNNEQISELKYYNPKYMKCFRTIDEIDFNWIKNKEDINYEYDGSFSPNRIVELVSKA